jgi:ATP phosphoribosyltransferase
MPKGRLFEAVRARLAGVGVGLRLRSERDYHPECDVPGVEATLYKPRSLPRLVDLGFCDVAFTGLDVVRDAMVDHVVPLVDLGVGRVRVVAAVPAARRAVLDSPPKRPLVIATEYPRLAGAWAMGRGLAHIVIESHGSTEAYVRHVADIVVDCVETGATLEQNGLVAVETILESTTCMIVRDSTSNPRVDAWAAALVDGGGARVAS